jgi:tRNA uridine 5-carboxymethylaminomethyl modification enzyme
VGEARRAEFARRTRAARAIHEAIEHGKDAAGTAMSRVLRTSAYEASDLSRWLSERDPGLLAEAGPWVVEAVYATRKYEPYIEKARAEIRRTAGMEHKPIPAWIDPAGLTTMRTEARQALTRFRPRTFGQASRLEGITPADLTLLAVLVERARAS